MNINQVIIGHRVVIEYGAVKEVVLVMGFTEDGIVIVRNTKNELVDVAPECIIKSFGV